VGISQTQPGQIPQVEGQAYRMRAITDLTEDKQPICGSLIRKFIFKFHILKAK